jgi:hypothetical protein
MAKPNIMGYNLIDAGNNEWYLQVVGEAAFTGTIKDVIKYAVYHLYFNFEEIESAINSMIETNSNAAHFGMFKKFIYPFNQDFTPIRKAS